MGEPAVPDRGLAGSSVLPLMSRLIRISPGRVHDDDLCSRVRSGHVREVIDALMDDPDEPRAKARPLDTADGAGHPKRQH
jgi:hypothetical protein